MAISRRLDGFMEPSERSATKRVIHLEQNPLHDEHYVKEDECAQSLENGREAESESHGRPTSAVFSSLSLPSLPTNMAVGPVMHIPPCMAQQQPQYTDLLQQATPCPPCTTATLRELDLHSIQNNLNLRIDICYDHDLFFQPISGRTGDSKRIEAEKYWLSLAAEFKIYWHDAQPSCGQCERLKSRSKIPFVQRLPILFNNLKEIVQMLVPDTEHEEVANHLDVDLLMQQVQRGALDIVRLSEWLASLLTSHCAPMRDNVADDITTDIRTGAERSDMQLLVGGLEKLFGLLEAMKLDIANHQIRSFRYPLIEDTVPFQQAWFSRALETKQISVARSQSWYLNARLHHQHDCTMISQEHTFSDFDFEVFIHAMVRLCDPKVRRVPTTFQHDHSRFVRLQEDLQDLIQMSLCLEVFNQRVFEVGGQNIDPTKMHESLKSRIIYLTEDEDGNGGAISDHLDAIGMEITQAAYTILGQSVRQCDSISDRDFSRTIKLLHDVFEHENVQQTVTDNFVMMLEQRTILYARTFLPMSTLEVSNIQRQWTQNRSSSASNKESLLADWDDMARRLAHIGVLHWRVWADLCYLAVGTYDSVYDEFHVYSPADSEFFADGESMASTPTSSIMPDLDSFLDSHQDLPTTRHDGAAAADLDYDQQAGRYNEELDFNENTIRLCADNIDVEFLGDIDIDMGLEDKKSKSTESKKRGTEQA